MRIRNVTIEGFGPFRTKQLVDFSAYDADGLFLIAGETGVGKSSILDAIAYALYNKTPRWGSVSATGASNAVRSDFCSVDDPTEVVVQFETNGEEYRVTRSPEFDRPKARGEGTTRQGSKILIEVLEGVAWIGKATKEREAAEFIEGLLNLNKDEFLQVIMLAQGRFQEFLLATSEQRLELLSKLFGTARFADYQDRIAERRLGLGRRVESIRQQRNMLLSGVDSPEELGPVPIDKEIDWLDAVIEDAVGGAENAKSVTQRAEKAEKLALHRLDVAKRQARRGFAREALAELEQRKESVGDERVALGRAEHAERVRPLLVDAAIKLKVCEGVGDEVELARSQYQGSATDDDLAVEVSQLTEDIGTLGEALRDEERANQLDFDRAAKTTEAESLTEELAQIAESITVLQEERAVLVPLSAQVKSAGDKVKQAKDRLAAATAAAEVAAALRTAQEAQLAADKLDNAGRLAAVNVLERFLHGQAAVLAEKLVPGEPCTVCGSSEHPSRASFPDERVTQEDVDAARLEADRLEPKAKAAKQKVDDLKIQAAGFAGVAGGGDVDILESAALQAQADLTAAEGAMLRITAIDVELNGDEGLIAKQNELEASTKRAETELTKLTTEYDALAIKITRLRGAFETVKARQGSLVVERISATRLVEAIAKLDTATKQRVDADAALVEKLKKEKFESAEEVDSSLLEDHEVEEVKTRIAEYTAALSENQGILKQPDLQDLPGDIIEVDDASAAHLGAQRATRVATTETANSESKLKRLETKREELAALLAESTELVAEYDVLHRLAETVNGRTPNSKSMSLESYYVAAELEDVLAAANVRLHTLSKGRFAILHTERGVRRAGAAAGLEIEIFDEYTGTARPANQLSGGQQFLASLALALGLAEVVTSRAGGIELNTLFVDEGFGSLSTEYLGIAMETLDSLKQGGRTVGVISHVTSMQEQIGAQLRVVAQPGGPSEILQAIV